VIWNAITARRSKPRIRRPGRRSALAAAIWKDYKVVAALLDALDIADRAFGAVPQCDVVVEVDQIAQRFRAEFNPVTHAASSLVDQRGGREW